MFYDEELKQKLDELVYLKVSGTVMRQRALARGMKDGIEDVIVRRIENFKRFTVRILDYYQHSDRLLTVDGEQAPEAVAT